MRKTPNRETLPGFLRDLDKRLAAQERSPMGSLAGSSAATALVSVQSVTDIPYPPVPGTGYWVEDTQSVWMVVSGVLTDEVSPGVKRTIADYLGPFGIANQTTYYPNTAARNADTRPRQIGDVAVTGNVAATPDGSHAPRRWIWYGSGWQFVDAWSYNGRAGCTLTSNGVAIANGATAYVPWTTDVQDVDGWHAGVSDQVIIPAGWGGRYAVTFSVGWQSSAANNGNLVATVNGVAVYAGVGVTAFGASSLAFHGGANAGTVFRFGGYQNTGATDNILSAALSIDWLGP